MNKVLLTGNVINIKVISNPSGNLNAFVTVSPVTWRKKTNQNQKSIFITVNFFDVSENYIDNLKKARLISVEGHVSTYNQKVNEEKIIKMLSIISDRCQVLLYKKPKSEEEKGQNFEFKNENNDDDSLFSEKKDQSDNKKPPYSSNGELDNLDDTMFLTDDGEPILIYVPKKKKKIIKKKKNRCFFTINKISYIDYKDVNLLKKFISANGKILSQKITNTSAFSQRQLTTAIKRARQVALLPYIVR